MKVFPWASFFKNKFIGSTKIIIKTTTYGETAERRHAIGSFPFQIILPFPTLLLLFKKKKKKVT